MQFRLATLDDCGLLAELNQQLTRDEGHRNPMNVAELAQRMHDWLTDDYEAVLFEESGEVVAYALFQEQSREINLRHRFVVRDRRRQGIGRRAMNILRTQVWPDDKRLTVDVLTSNPAGVAFWRAVGYRDYCLRLEIRPPE
jgi:GNAT superfamily N-acetyltransferase